MDNRQIDLCKYRLEKAEQCLKSAEALKMLDDYCSAANRSYYAIFHSIRAVLALEGVDFSKHAGVLSYFQRNYVKTGIFDREYSKILTDAFEIRSDSDYDDYYVLSKEDVEMQLKNARFFVDGITQYLNKILRV